jgi:uncharacterized membrane protein YphA (DoxX/SURF4 family)
MDQNKLENSGLVLLRVGLALVFLWFGAEQLLHPNDWISYIPEFLNNFFLPPVKLVMINGLFEVVASILLILNIHTRIVALLLAIHMIGIAISIGINPIGVRDLGLSVATLSLSLISRTPQRN